VIPFGDVVQLANTVEEWEAALLDAQTPDPGASAAPAPLNMTGISSPSRSQANYACG
jgi:hypothetical protein